ncbi:hypothetical protein SNS2_0184 [Streptomyces netropsis]|uniref:Uncharacterized protein n=1 Tax=Streptomyces syringium TaxID=76729 RepID=A0ABS4XYS4_9ACTN|nr:hypothetical protein [Streptomyces syringium]MBP2401656.1 hypothetical protein [Streptomyces syringium]SPE47779.1 hypothetical protein SNS2_0184 [Streptomyces netropsis]
MPIEFKPVTFSVGDTPMGDSPCKQTVGFVLHGKVRKDDRNKSVWSVALQSYSLEAVYNHNADADQILTFDQVGLKIVGIENPDYDAAVELTIWRRTRPGATPDVNRQFRGTVTALVIADVTST